MWLKPKGYAINLDQIIMASDEDSSIVVSSGKHIPLTSYEYALIKQAIEEQINERPTNKTKPRSTRNKVSK